MAPTFKAHRRLPTGRQNINKWVVEKLKELKKNKKEQFAAMEKYFPAFKKVELEISHLRHLDENVLAAEIGLHSSVAKLLYAIETNPTICMCFHNMYSQQADVAPPGGVYVKTWQEAILLINALVNEAPVFDTKALIPVPLNAILNLPMATPAGNTCFLNDDVNVIFKKIMNEWGKYLMTGASCYVLTSKPNGWFSPEALEAMPNFAKTYVCSPTEDYWGYTSFDDFFIRIFRDNARPVDSPNDKSVVVSACEAAPLRIAYNVKRFDSFWIKEQNYSMEFILNRSSLAAQFYGGTVYQAFLSPTTYHRFHSPVDGFIKEYELVAGTYYSQPYFKNDNSLLNEAQPYLAQVATRGVYYIQADNPNIGLMVFIALGMSDVSTVETTVNVLDVVTKGQELGVFHFGGSSSLLIFRPDVNIEFDQDIIDDAGMNASNVEVNKRVGQVLAPIQPKKK